MQKRKKMYWNIRRLTTFFKDQPLEVEQMEKVFDFLEASGVDVLRITGNDERADSG